MLSVEKKKKREHQHLCYKVMQKYRSTEVQRVDDDWLGRFMDKTNKFGIVLCNRSRKDRRAWG